MRALGVDIELVGDGLPVPCLDGVDRPYLNLDAAASTSALPGSTRPSWLPIARCRTADFLAFSGHKMYAPYGAGAPGAGAADEGCQGSFT